MKILTIKRVALTSIGVFGTIHGENSVPFALSLELPWLDNQREKSCIPKGEYLADRAFYKGRYDSFLLRDVPNRDGIFIHKGNWTSDTLGCILLGESFAPMLNPHTGKIEPGVASSCEAHNEFMGIMKGQQEFRLVIIEV